MEAEYGELVIDFEPDLNEVNFRRMELVNMIAWLKTDKTFNDEFTAVMVDNAEKELKLIVDEMQKEFEGRDE